MISATDPTECALQAIATVFPNNENVAVMFDIFDKDEGFTGTFYKSKSLTLVKKQQLVMLPKWNIGYSKNRRFKDANVAILKIGDKIVIILNAKKSPLHTAVDLLYAVSFILTIKEGGSNTDVGLRASQAYAEMLVEYTKNLDKGFNAIRDYIKPDETK